MIIITSDHGDALGEAGRAGHQYLEDDNLMVPLLIKLPEDEAAGTRVGRQVGLIDVLQTIEQLRALGYVP